MTAGVVLKPQTGLVASARRVVALVRRHAYLIAKSWPRIVSLMYYPTVTLILWAFLTLYLAPQASVLRDAPGIFLAAVLLWDTLFRGQLGVSLTFIEEMYARNLGNLFVAPLSLAEFIVAQIAMSVLRTAIGMGGACLAAWLLFHYSIFELGFPLIAFAAGLIAFGWAIGLAVCALVLEWGLGAEELAWAAIFLVMPVSGVYYPVSVLPGWLQGVAAAIPSSHLFEGMRAVLLQGVVPWQALATAFALDAAYLAGGAALFAWAVRRARRDGRLLQMGE
ncbi:MAG: ABC transporter permease [Burkholderiales bacterium]